jgi:hypothetical protein
VLDVGGYVELSDTPLFIENIDVSRYRAADRKIRHIFNRASAVLVAMVINFAHSRDLAVPGGHGGRGWHRRKAALDALLAGGYVKSLYAHWHDMAGGKGRCRIYRCTSLFKQTFRFRLPSRLIIIPSVLIKHKDAPLAHNRKNMNSIPALSSYTKLAEDVELSLSNGGQVFRKVGLYRVNGKRLYAFDIYNYQNGIPKEERPHLLINGESTAELDFSAMHGNMLLNRVGGPCQGDFYERILKELGVRPTEERRNAVKQLTNATFNVDIHGYGGALGGAVDEHSKKRLVEMLGVRPKQVYEAILRAYPMLAPYVCTGKHWEWLQTTDSEIMIDVLETLAMMGIVGLPVHDSVIAPARYANTAKAVMRGCYKNRMGFEPYIK